MSRAGFLVIALAGATAFAQAPIGPTSENAKQHQAAGVAAYKAKDFATASKEFAAAYAAERYSGFLFSWAQSDRQRGECSSAVDLYQRFLDTSPPPDFAQLARDGIAACGGTSAKPEPLPPPTTVPAISGDDKLEVPERPPTATGFPHKLSVALLATGVALGGTSAYFYLAARGDAKDANRAATYPEVARLYERSEDRLLVARITAGVGLTFVVASVIRFALTDTPKDDGVAFGVSPTGDVFVSGAF